MKYMWKVRNCTWIKSSFTWSTMRETFRRILMLSSTLQARMSFWDMTLVRISSPVKRDFSVLWHHVTLYLRPQWVLSMPVAVSTPYPPCQTEDVICFLKSLQGLSVLFCWLMVFYSSTNVLTISSMSAFGSIFWTMMPFSQLKVKWPLGRICRLQLQCRRTSPAGYQREAGRKQSSPIAGNSVLYRKQRGTTR
jgi:hypothetical protein